MNGVNVYPAWDRSSSGFIIKLGKIAFKVRYSKRIQKWFVKLELVPKPSYTDYSI
jgi:hypothetical protein